MMGVIDNQKKMLEQQADQIAWLRQQFEKMTANVAK